MSTSRQPKIKHRLGTKQNIYISPFLVKRLKPKNVFIWLDSNSSSLSVSSHCTFVIDMHHVMFILYDDDALKFALNLTMINREDNQNRAFKKKQFIWRQTLFYYLRRRVYLESAGIYNSRTRVIWELLETVIVFWLECDWKLVSQCIPIY